MEDKIQQIREKEASALAKIEAAKAQLEKDLIAESNKLDNILKEIKGEFIDKEKSQCNDTKKEALKKVELIQEENDKKIKELLKNTSTLKDKLIVKITNNLLTD